MNNGFVVLWRKFKDTSFYKDSYAVHLALHLIMRANHEDRKIVFNKEELTIHRGQTVAGRFTLADETGMHPSMIMRRLALLSNVGFLDIKSNNRFSLITIRNYKAYQDKKDRIGQHIEQPANNQRTQTTM